MDRIYVLKCKNNYYYIGKTRDVDRRFAEHLSGDFGSEWTRLHSPIDIIENVPMKSKFDEMIKTLEYMDKYGIENVRGAQWSNKTLTKEQRNEIERQINTDSCYRCGEKGHFAIDCTVRKSGKKRKMDMRQIECDRCGRNSHLEDECYAKYDIDGEPLECHRCGRESHFEDQCYATFDVDGDRID